MPRATERFRLIGLPAPSRHARFARAVATGLTVMPKRLPCCYFYDQAGSELFEAICELPEYYVTRAESAILETHARDIVAAAPASTLIELGSGAATKTRWLLDAFMQHQGTLRYVPVDICRTVLEDSSRALLRAYPTLEILAVAGEYQEALTHLQSEGEPKLILWLGSNIGNFARDEAATFLTRVRQTLNPGDRLLVGIDLRKDRKTLEAAYDDSRGVTADFNRNLLVRINQELGGHFNPASFAHRAVYDEAAGRIQMYLVNECAQSVAIDELNLVVPFAAGEAIHTEDSYKYSLEEIATLARSAGLVVVRQWFDVARRFCETLFASPPLGD